MIARVMLRYLIVLRHTSNISFILSCRTLLVILFRCRTAKRCGIRNREFVRCSPPRGSGTHSPHHIVIHAGHVYEVMYFVGVVWGISALCISPGQVNESWYAVDQCILKEDETISVPGAIAMHIHCDDIMDGCLSFVSGTATLA